MEKRFGAQQNSDITLNRFLKSLTPQSREEFTEILKGASVICTRKLISMEALAQMILNKVPTEIKGLLYQNALIVTDCDNFVQRAEEMAWIAYPDKMLARVQQESESTKAFRPRTSKITSQRNHKQKSMSQKYCIIHGEGSHTSKECMRLTEILQHEGAKTASTSIRTEENLQDDE
ncbi:hypothetical protein NGRA_2911 [Nosema granulosis]|uniref:Uncharacterized protein n=1 Tax=Nosema granulosis TaxID=83296 RepID=A0A9P6GVQ5_9MICR|nr:hypothetical protein NGRA_2911 [Nosema granulosis]